MPETFDAYRKWLGIPAQDQPPHHYRLLGIPVFEDDSDVIQNAADRQMAHVRSFQSGRYSQYSQHLLNELAVAKLCLLDAQRKAVYDGELRATLALGTAGPAAPPIPPPAPPPKAVAEPEPLGTTPPPVSTPAIRSRSHRRRRRGNRYLLPVALAVLSITALIVIGILAAGK